MTTPAQVRGALVTMLQGIDGAVPYALDLSGSTFHGMEPLGSRPAGPQAYVWRGQASYARADQATLGGWLSERTYALTVYADSADRTNSSRETQLDTIEADVMTALDAALLPGGALGAVNVLDVTDIQFIPRFASQPNAQSQPCSLDVLITLRYIRGR